MSIGPLFLIAIFMHSYVYAKGNTYVPYSYGSGYGIFGGYLGCWKLSMRLAMALIFVILQMFF